MSLPTVTAPPPVPSRSGGRETFSDRMDAFNAWMGGSFYSYCAALPDAMVAISSAVNFNGTSVSNVTIGMGAKTFTIQTGKAFQIGQTVKVASTATPTNYVEGPVTGYNAANGQLDLNVITVGGSGTFTAWTASLAVSAGALSLTGGTMTGRFITKASTSTEAGFNLPHGAAPSAPANGDMWVTTSGLYVQINGTTYDFLPRSGGTVTGTTTFSGSARFGDGQFFHALYGGQATINYDGNDFMYYDRGTNTWTWCVAASATMALSAGGVMTLAGDRVVTRTAPIINSPTINTPTINTPTLTSPTINSAPVSTVAGTAPLSFNRARVTFNGTGTVAINNAENVSSITDNGVGDYTINFTTAMPDAHHAASGICRYSAGDYMTSISPHFSTSPVAGSLRIKTGIPGSGYYDMNSVQVIIGR